MIEAHTQRQRPPGTTTPHPPKTKARCDGSATGQQERNLQLMYAHFKAVALLARGFLCQNRRTVLVTPNKRKESAAKWRIFSRPKFDAKAGILALVARPTVAANLATARFWGREGLSVRKPARLVTCDYPRPHQLRVVGALVVPLSVQQGTKTMHMATTQRPSAHTAHHGHTLPMYRGTPAHAGHPCNPDRLTVGNAPMLAIEPVKGGAQ